MIAYWNKEDWLDMIVHVLMHLQTLVITFEVSDRFLDRFLILCTLVSCSYSNSIYYNPRIKDFVTECFRAKRCDFPWNCKYISIVLQKSTFCKNCKNYVKKAPPIVLVITGSIGKDNWCSNLDRLNFGCEPTQNLHSNSYIYKIILNIPKSLFSSR